MASSMYLWDSQQILKLIISQAILIKWRRSLVQVAGSRMSMLSGALYPSNSPLHAPSDYGALMPLMDLMKYRGLESHFLPGPPYDACFNVRCARSAVRNVHGIAMLLNAHHARSYFFP